MKYIIIILCLIFCCPLGYSENIIVKSNPLISKPLRNGNIQLPDSIIFQKDITEIHIPNMESISRLGDYDFTNLKKITFGDIDYLPGGLFYDMPNLEEIIFEGRIGHFDCVLAANCPSLRKIVFKGPISSTGGPGFFYNLPNLKEVIFESVVGYLGMGRISENSNCPNLNKIDNNGAFINVFDDSYTPKTPLDNIKNNPKLIKDLENLANWQSEILNNTSIEFFNFVTYQSAKNILPILKELDSPISGKLEDAMKYAWSHGDDVKTKLEILKESPAYNKNDTIPNIKFKYADPSDSLLIITRNTFNLDSIAGNGNDISKIKNLMYWVHNNIEHDGSNGLAPGVRNLINTYECSKRDSCGYNCRALAISLTEALLAVGIPSRYITCLPKDYENDEDCHVISVAWSDSLNKWIWVDPTFAAYITDENGLLLHPGEVRYRLQNDLPLYLNDDANYNNIYKEEKEDYLDEYMAKNLYILDSNSFNQSEPEGQSCHEQGLVIALVPEGLDYPYCNFKTSNEEWFWQAPQ